jgi:hypothetical protein
MIRYSKKNFLKVDYINFKKITLYVNNIDGEVREERENSISYSLLRLEWRDPYPLTMKCY